MRRRRRLGIEFGMCRSGRIGGASGSVIVGKGRFFALRGRTGSGGGNRSPFGDQEAVGGDAECGVVVEAAPAAAFIMAEPELLLELLVIPLDPPAQFGDVDQTVEGASFGQGGKP